MATKIWVNIGSGNGLLPDGTKPFTWTNVDWSSVKSSDIHIRAISQEMPQPSIPKISFKITYLKFYSNFPGASELRVWSIIRKGRHYFKKNFTYLVSSDLYWQIGETIFEIRHVSKLNGNVMKSMSFKIGMSKDSRQARFFLVSAL